jgi:hypothetical protein
MVEATLQHVEGILIAAMPTSNNSSPRFPRIELQARIGRLLKRRREIIEELPRAVELLKKP